MAGLLGAEGYKLRKSKAFYVCMAVMATTVVLIYGMMCAMGVVRVAGAEVVVMSEGGSPAPGAMSESDGSAAMQEAAPDNAAPLPETLSLPELVQQLFSGDFMEVILTVFVSIFVVGEYGSGMMKNIVGKGKSRSMIFLAKCLMTLAAEVLFILAGVAAMLLCGLVTLGGRAFDAGWSGMLAVYVGQQILLLAGLTAVFILIGEVCRNLAAAISVGIAVSALTPVILMGADLLCAKLPFTPSEYWIVNRSMALPLAGLTGSNIVKNVLIALFWLLAATAAGMYHFNRADVK